MLAILSPLIVFGLRRHRPVWRRWYDEAVAPAETSWALAAPALKASRPPPSAATPIARFIHKFTWTSPSSATSRTWSTSPEVARRERRAGGRSAR